MIPDRIRETPRSTPLRVTFAQSGKTVTTDGRRSILELAEAADIEIQVGCRGGGCGLCKVRCLSGRVDMPSTDGLAEGDQGEGFVLSCIGCPRTHVTIHA